MRMASCLLATFLTTAGLAAQDALPRLVGAELGPAPWNVQSGGITAFDVTLDERGAVKSAEIVQDVAPYGTLLGDALPSWRFEPARKDGLAVPSRVLVLGFFRPPGTTFAAPENPRYKSTTAPEELPWPTSVLVPPYPMNAVGSGKVILEADVSDSGTVTAARILTEPTPFDSGSSDTLRQWKFRPASRGNREVASRVFVVFSFVGTTP